MRLSSQKKNPILREECEPKKKTQCFDQKRLRSAQKLQFDLYIFACSAKQLVKVNRVFMLDWESLENQFSQPEKKIFLI